MSSDRPHMIVTALLIFAFLLVTHRTAIYENASRGKRVASVAVALFLDMFIFNLIWPNGEGFGVMGEPRDG